MKNKRKWKNWSNARTWKGCKHACIQVRREEPALRVEALRRLGPKVRPGGDPDQYQ